MWRIRKQITPYEKEETGASYATGTRCLFLSRKELLSR